MDKIFIGVIIGVISGVTATLVGVISTYFLTQRSNRRKEFNEAAEKFIFAFQDEFSRLKHGRESVTAILKPATFKHQSASHIFRQYVPETRRRAFDVAWKKYITDAPSQYNDETINENLDEKYRTKMLTAIEHLLEFAEIN